MGYRLTPSSAIEISRDTLVRVFDRILQTDDNGPDLGDQNTFPGVRYYNNSNQQIFAVGRN